MARIVLGGLTTLNLATHLDPMFTEIYSGAFAGMTFSSGNVGINITPTAGLHVNKDASSYIAKFERPTITSRLAFYSATNMFNIDAEGASNQLNIATNGVTRLVYTATGPVIPGADNTQTLGSGAFRWSVVYAGTGSINTSDARDKTDVRPMNTQEIAASKALASEIGVFRFLAAVAEKGDDAREHIGLTVQRAIGIMSAHGLSPFRYAFICHDQWAPSVEPAKFEDRDTGLKDLQGNPIIEQVEVKPERNIPGGDRYGFRYDQLIMFIMRGLEARISALEA